MAKRLLELSPTDLFGEKAILTDLSGREEISQPYEFFLTIASPKDGLKPEEVVGRPLGVRIDREEKEPRFIHGYISHLWAGDYSQTLDDKSAPSRIYRVRLVPWLWFLKRASRSFVYLPEKKEKSIQEILDAVFERVDSYGHVETWHEAGAASHLKSRKVEHCVQYRESDFHFLTRTLEKYGVYYYFRHEEDKHTLILSDRPNYPNALESEVEYHPSSNQHRHFDTLSEWEHAYEFVSGKYEQTEYDFENPSNNLKVNAAKHSSISLSNNSGYELFDYPGEYVQKGDGEELVVRRLEEEETRFDRVQASGSCKSFCAGYVFKLVKHHSCSGEEGKSYLITSIAHSASQPGSFSSQGVDASYSNQFSCIPNERQFRPARTTARPNLSSVQTAIVVGPAGEEIYTDEFGRVKVQFYWDREGKRDENTSCWVRVSQQWSGKGWGGMQIPHIGHEVVVAFLEGDPDRPLIVGRVYNAEQNVPMPLPDEKTRSVLRDYGGNETVMEGAEGKQFIHTQQTCGNEFLMDGVSGQEKIELRDKYGNEIVLDAVEGIIRIYSPTHESEIVLGRSINLSTLSNLVTNILGDEWNTIQGGKHQNVVGITSQLVGGWKQETVIGAETKINVGATVNWHKGYHLQLREAKQFTKTKDALVEVRNDVLATALSTQLAIAGVHELGASDIHDRADKIEIHGEQSVEMVAAKAEIEAKIAKLIGKKTSIEASTCNIKSTKTDIGSGALKVKGSKGKSPKSAKKRKKSKGSMPAVKKKKAQRKAQKLARRAQRGK
ncbi:type VI secretion system Vgr family protein [Aureliella helgolandensis]|uniref:Phage-related baseplate assembly protein n=1 Tax=Aureliella helgolandensis TaxID=2527968 RepID=A0A518GAK3_9BACT|nr:type VI secretion system tip protein TssI/VgrG [Aureliella helgolandensis]QDV25617.1 Phage-related baseplate assembly protein [Aureliella helgolandensis]